MGASVCCSGVCLTVVDKGPGWFAVTASGETRARTTIGGWREGTPVNFERSLKLGDELGGHIVTGHVDGVARVLSIVPDGASRRFTFETPVVTGSPDRRKGFRRCRRHIAHRQRDRRQPIRVNIIPHTLDVTTSAGEGRRPGEPGNRHSGAICCAASQPGMTG